MFVLVLPQWGETYLKVIRFIALPVSYFFLIEFGARIIVETKRKYVVLRASPILLLTVWAIIVESSTDRFLFGDILARYLLAIPGASLAATGLLLQLPIFRKSGLPAIMRYLKLASAALYFYGFFSGFIVPGADFFPASTINYSLFINKVGAPVEVFRVFCALALTYSLIRVLNVFDWETKKALRKSQKKYEELFDSTLDGVFQVNADGIFTLMNRSGAGILGYETAGEIIGRPSIEYWINPGDRDAYWTELRVRKSLSAYPIKAKKKNGEPIELESSSRIIEDEEGNFLGIEGILRDVTDRKNMEEQLHLLSLTDELTGLYNRRGFLTLAEHLLKMTDRLRRGLFMLYADLDYLKEINDTFGHPEGDKALVEIAHLLKENFRNSDIIARIGGDEFVVIPVGFAGDDIHLIADRLQKSLEISNSGTNRSWELSMSAGMAYYDPENPCSIDELLIQGDRAMYEEKKRKKTFKNKLLS